MSAAADFNDPFDLGCAVVVEGSLKQLKKRMKRLIEAHHTGSRKFQRLKLREMSKLPRDEVQQRSQSSIDQTRLKTGIVSLTTLPRSIQMWSHYANHHQGVCLQFELAHDPFRLIKAVSVEYNDDFPIINYVKDTGAQILPVMLRKQTGWSYERERRIVVPDGAHTHYTFNASALTGVILGCRIAAPTRSAIDALLTERIYAGLPQPALYQARLHTHKYALVVRKAAKG